MKRIGWQKSCLHIWHVEAKMHDFKNPNVSEDSASSAASYETCQSASPEPQEVLHIGTPEEDQPKTKFIIGSLPTQDSSATIVRSYVWGLDTRILK